MRSNDAWLGLPYDVFCFTTLQKIVAAALGIECDWYQHQVGSMHLYGRNVRKTRNVEFFSYPEEERFTLNGARGYDAVKTVVDSVTGRFLQMHGKDVKLPMPALTDNSLTELLQLCKDKLCLS